MLILMSDTRRILSLSGRGKSLPGATHTSAVVRQSVSPGASVASSTNAVGQARTSPRMNSAGSVQVRATPRYSISEGAARQFGVSSASFAAVPLRDFHAAMADASFPALNPRIGMPAPAALVDLLSHGKRILLVGHVFPDHDTVGATLTLARALKLLGKHVDVCIDDELSHTHQRLALPNEIRRASDLKGNTWDVAVVVDVASSGRIGDARDLLKRAKQVSVIDHHEEGDRDDLVSRYRAQATWHDGFFDAASLQVCAITEQLLAGMTLKPGTLKALYMPALAGIWTDTAGGTRDTMDPSTSQYFKYIALKSGVLVEDITARVKFVVPNSLRAAIAQKQGLMTRQVLGDSRRMTVLGVNRSGWNKLLATARSEVPAFAESDLMQVLKGELPACQRAFGCAALVVQQQSSAVVSARSNDGRARELCAEFRGNGHRDAASATLYGFESFDAVLGELERRARQRRLIG